MTNNTTSESKAENGAASGAPLTHELQYKVPFGVAALRYLKGFSSKGRSSRSDFWYGLLFGLVLDWGIDGIIGETMLYTVIAIAFLILDIQLWWRRMQDLGKSGWWCLVPFYNLYLAAQPSQAGTNKFGPVPNTEPFVVQPLTNKIAMAVMGVSLLLAIIGGCLGGDSAEDALREIAEGIVEKNQDKFFARLYIEGATAEKIEANKDVMNMVFEKFMKEFRDERTARLMKDPEIVDVVEDGDDTFVKFAPSDKALKSSFAAEGLAGMMVKAVETDEGWKICLDAMRPIFASKEEVAAARKNAEREALAEKAKADANAAAKAVEDLNDAVLKGRKLYLAMVEANTGRECAGLTSLFPHLGEDDGLSDDKDDIASRKFDTSREYFSELFDVKNRKRGDWKPYVEGLDLGCISLCGDECTSDYLNESQVNWMVVAGLTDEMDDKMPVLVSANIEPSYLTFKAGKKNFSNDGRLIPVGKEARRYGDATWWNDAVVVIRKSGTADVIKKDACTLKAIFGQDELDLKSDVSCLAP